MRPLRFSIRGLLLLIVVVAVATSVYQRRMRVRKTVIRFEELGGTVGYRSSFLDGIHRATGNFFATPVELDLARCSVARGGLKGIDHLQDLERVYLHRTSIGTEDVEALSRCQRIRRLSLWGNASLFSPALEPLVNLPELQVLDLSETRICPGDLGRLQNANALRELVVSADFHSGAGDCFNGAAFQKLSHVEQIRFKGDCFLYQFDSEQLRRFCRTDTTRINDLILRDCELDEAACAAINRLKVRSLDIQACDFGEKRLGFLDPLSAGRVDFYNRVDNDQPVTREALSDWMPEGLSGVSIYPDRIEFDYSDRFAWRYRLSASSTPLTDGLVERWKNLGMQEIELAGVESLEEDLQVLARHQEGLGLAVYSGFGLKKNLDGLRRLRSLRIYRTQRGTLRFPEAMEIRELELRGRVSLTRELAREISRLRQLESLTVPCEPNANAAVLEPLMKLPSLTFINLLGANSTVRAKARELTALNEKRQSVTP